MKTQSTATPKLFIGLDIHKQSWSVHIRTDISDHKSFTTPAHGEVLYQYVSKHLCKSSKLVSNIYKYVVHALGMSTKTNVL